MSGITRLIAIMAALRDPDSGCPWDREQTFASLVHHTLEEAYEVAEVIEQDNLSGLCDELGDLLFQVVFYSRLAEEEGIFDFEDVVTAISNKLTRRHPHVFGDEKITDAAEQSLAWEEHKRRERQATNTGSGTLSGVALNLPAMTRAVKLQKRAARVGFDWPEIQPVFDKVSEEILELRDEVAAGVDPDRIEEELGDLLFACANLARHTGHDPETALRNANRKFEQRFRFMESELMASGWKAATVIDLESWEKLWVKAKSQEGK